MALKRKMSESSTDMRSLFQELGFAVIKNNLALRYPGFPHEELRRQYERMLSIMIDDQCELDLKEPVDPCTFDVLGRLYESMAHTNGTRKKAGEFYTPAFVVDYMVDLLGLEADAGLEDRKFIDIACGSGAFIVAGMKKVIRSLKEQGVADADILHVIVDHFYGLDISRTACDICKTNMYIVLLDELGPYVLSQAGEIRLNIFTTNAVDNGNNHHGGDGEAARIKGLRGKYAGGFDYILGNPPYLEAKKMPAELKNSCRESWPEISGAFDLYVPFVLQCNRLVSGGGKVCLILPDKFTVAKYAMRLRKKLLHDFSLLDLVDLSEMDIFSRAMVYPAVIAYENSRPSPGGRVRTRQSVGSGEELAARNGYAMVPQELYGSIGSHSTYFCLPGAGDFAGMLRRIFDAGDPIRRFVDFRSTVSFHQKGLREQFVRQTFDGEPGTIIRYLGGRSYAKRNEVDLFQLRWEGFFINYDQARLKECHNVLPPLSNFLREKIILCQHAPRITAAYDGNGEYVTKDVYPLGIAAPGLAGSPFSLKYFSALLNSELMSFVYGTIYKGIQIGGGYYHYLPTWIDVLPVIVPEEKEIERIERLADRMIVTNDRAEKLRLINEADAIFYDVYRINEEQQAIIKRTVPGWNAQVS